MEAKFLLAFALLIAATSAIPKQFSLKAELDQHWETFKKVYGKVYDNEMELVRRMIWEKNVMMIQLHNLEYDMGKHTYTLGMNAFGDMTHDEFKARYSRFIKTKTNKTDDPVFMRPLNVHVLPNTVDWRTKGYVTPVKDQGGCESSWAFSATGSIEGQHFRKTGILVSLSEQQLVDCSESFGNDGCKGGVTNKAFQYVSANKGIDTEASYHYNAMEVIGVCCSAMLRRPHGDIVQKRIEKYGRRVLLLQDNAFPHTPVTTATQ